MNKRLREVIFLFLKLGFTAFGGPAAHIAMMHDEVVIEEPNSGRTLDEVCHIMGESIGWAPGLLLRADGYKTEYYKKD